MATEPIDTGALIRQIGETLWGERWQAALSAELGLNARTVRRLASGRQAPPIGVIEQLAEMVTDRRDELAELTAVIEELRRRQA
jgi:hypothetical protein